MKCSNCHFSLIFRYLRVFPLEITFMLLLLISHLYSMSVIPFICQLCRLTQRHIRCYLVFCIDLIFPRTMTKMKKLFKHNLNNRYSEIAKKWKRKIQSLLIPRVFSYVNHVWKISNKSIYNIDKRKPMFCYNKGLPFFNTMKFCVKHSLVIMCTNGGLDLWDKLVKKSRDARNFWFMRAFCWFNKTDQHKPESIILLGKRFII